MLNTLASCQSFVSTCVLHFGVRQYKYLWYYTWGKDNEIVFIKKKKKVKTELRATEVSQMEPLNIPLDWVMTNFLLAPSL